MPHLPPASVSPLLHPLLSIRFSDDAATVSAAKSLWSAATLARLSADTLTSLSTAAEAAFPSHLRKASAATLADQASFILQLRSLALPQPAAQDLLLRLCGAESEWASVAQAAAVSVKGIDYIRLGASAPAAPVAATSLSVADCATHAHLAVLLLQRGLLQHAPVSEPGRAAALLACVALFAVTVRSQEARAENNLVGITPEDLTDAALL